MTRCAPLADGAIIGENQVAAFEGGNVIKEIVAKLKARLQWYYFVWLWRQLNPEQRRLIAREVEVVYQAQEQNASGLTTNVDATVKAAR